MVKIWATFKCSQIHMNLCSHTESTLCEAGICCRLATPSDWFHIWVAVARENIVRFSDVTDIAFYCDMFLRLEYIYIYIYIINQQNYIFAFYIDTTIIWKMFRAVAIRRIWFKKIFDFILLTSTNPHSELYILMSTYSFNYSGYSISVLKKWPNITD